MCFDIKYTSGTNICILFAKLVQWLKFTNFPKPLPKSRSEMKEEIVIHMLKSHKPLDVFDLAEGGSDFNIVDRNDKLQEIVYPSGNQHEIRKFVKPKKDCPQCSKQFLNKSLSLEHIKKVMEEKSLSCARKNFAKLHSFLNQN